MKFSDAVRGKRAEREIEFPGSDPPIKLLVRPLTGTEVAQSYNKAAEFAEGKKENPEAPLFKMAQMAAVLAIGCLDIDSPENNRQPFFDGGFAQVMGLDYEVIAYMYEHHESWQSQCSPYATKLSFSDLIALVDKEVEQDDDRFFMRLAPGLRWSFTHILACLLGTSLEGRSLLTALTLEDTELDSSKRPTGLSKKSETEDQGTGNVELFVSGTDPTP